MSTRTTKEKARRVREREAVMDRDKPPPLPSATTAGEMLDLTWPLLPDSEKQKAWDWYDNLTAPALAEQRARLEKRIQDLEGLIYYAAHFLENRRYKPPEIVEEMLDGMKQRFNKALADAIERGEESEG